MSFPNISENALPESDQPLHKAAQRLRWFVDVFSHQVEQTSAETGNQFSVSHSILAKVFDEWFQAFEAQKPSYLEDKRAYVGFAAGLMLKSLIRQNPVTKVKKPDKVDDTNPAYFWPEGHLYVAFCLNVRGLVLESDYQSHQQPSALLDEVQTWWSFQENVAQDPAMAIAFLDLFAGDQPDWTFPELFRTGKIHALADRFYTRDQKLAKPGR